MHYKRLCTHGEIGEAEPLKGAGAICKMPDCVELVQQNNLCESHIAEKKAAARKCCPPGMPLKERLSFIGWHETADGCWEWSGARSRNGYGKMAYGNGTTAGSHRVSYEVHRGPIPDGLFVRHKCDNPPCINPDHLELGTPADNSRDMVERNRTRGYVTGRYGGTCVKGLHAVTSDDDLVVSKRGAHMCAACYREIVKRSAEKRAAQRKGGARA